MTEIKTPYPTTVEAWRDPFVTWLEELRDRDDGDARKMLAAMKRWLAPSLHSHIEAAQVVQPCLFIDDGNAREGAAYLIGALFALHDDAGGSGNMGDHFRALCEPGKDPPPNVERRFMSLLAAEGDEFDRTLRQAVTLLKAKGVPVNWHQLMCDAQAWKSGRPKDQDRVRKWWSKQFWRRTKPIQPDESADEPNQPIANNQ